MNRSLIGNKHIDPPFQRKCNNDSRCVNKWRTDE